MKNSELIAKLNEKEKELEKIRNELQTFVDDISETCDNTERALADLRACIDTLSELR